MRAFVAIELGGEARPRVEALLAALAATPADVRWARPEQLHLTLRFLGEAEPELLERLAESLAPVAAGAPRFAVSVDACGGFPSLARPRALWVGVSAPPLAALARAVDAACVAHGFASEARAFRPHVTLGRVRGGRAALDPAARRLLADAAATAFGRSPVDEIVLFRSERSPRGARYTPLARAPLGGAAAG